MENIMCNWKKATLKCKIERDFNKVFKTYAFYFGKAMFYIGAVSFIGFRLRYTSPDNI